MEWSGHIFINKIIKLNGLYSIYIDPLKSSETFKSLSEYYNETNKEIIMNLQINPMMLCNSYDQYKIKSTKKFLDIDFTNSRVYIKLKVDNQQLLIKTLTKTIVTTNILTNKSPKFNSRKARFTSELIEICKKN